MWPAPELVGAGQLLAAIIALLFLKPVSENRETNGAREFAVFIGGTVVWSLGHGVGKFITDLGVSLGTYKLVLLGVHLAAAGWFLTAVTVVRDGDVPRAVVRVVLAAVLVLQGLIWTNPIHQFVLGPGTTLQETVLIPEYGPGFWLHTVVGYLLVLGGTAYLALEAYRSAGLRRKQMGLLALSSLPFFIANVVTVSDVVLPAYDLSQFGYLVSAVLFGLVLFEGRFLDITTVARRTAMAEMDEAVITLDAENRVVDCNRAARQLFDTEADYHGIPAATFFHPVPSAVLDRFEETMDTETEVTVQLDGTERHFLLSISPVGGTAMGGRVIVLREITSLKEREQSLRRQNERLDEFASVVSHDLRNPLNVAAGNLGLVEKTGDLGRTDEIRDSLNRMETIIEDLLLLTETGNAIDATEPVEIGTVARDAWVQVKADDVEIEIDADRTIEADRSRLRQLFENLFRNTIDHNEPPLTITVELLSDPDVIGFAVADDGGGIPSAKHEQVFEHGHTTSTDGTGLGLSIVQNIVSAHGWEVEITASETGGARFEIRTDQAHE